MNRKVGMYAAALTFFSVIGFAFSMLIGANSGSYFSNMFIAWGIVPMICSFAAYAKKEVKSASYTAMAFAAIYSAYIAARFSIFFSYNLLGYGFMALAVFFAALTLEVKNTGDRWLKRLMMIHGIFGVSGFIVPILGVFKPEMDGDLAGIIILEFWCAYFMPICILSYRYFKNQTSV